MIQSMLYLFVLNTKNTKLFEMTKYFSLFYTNIYLYLFCQILG